MIQARIYQTAGGLYAVAVGSKVIRVDLTYEQADQILRETLDQIRTRQQARERETLRQAFGRLNEI
jgi:hypothetical protein